MTVSKLQFVVTVLALFILTSFFFIRKTNLKMISGRQKLFLTRMGVLLLKLGLRKAHQLTRQISLISTKFFLVYLMITNLCRYNN